MTSARSSTETARRRREVTCTRRAKPKSLPPTPTLKAPTSEGRGRLRRRGAVHKDDSPASTQSAPRHPRPYATPSFLKRTSLQSHGRSWCARSRALLSHPHPKQTSPLYIPTCSPTRAVAVPTATTQETPPR